MGELKTLPTGLALFLQGGPGDTIEWGGRMAAGVMVIIPSLVFFLLASGRLTRGLATGAVTGELFGPNTPIHQACSR